MGVTPFIEKFALSVVSLNGHFLLLTYVKSFSLCHTRIHFAFFFQISQKSESVGPPNVWVKAPNDKSTMTDKPKPQYHPITMQILNDEKKCKAMTGLSKGLFEVNYELLLDDKAFLDMNSLHDRDQLAIFLVKLKTGNTLLQIGVMFGVSDQTVAKVFTHLLEKIYKIAQNYVWWYSREEVDHFMPESFKKHYPHTRVILDASEIKIQCPGKVDCAVLCYSNYKSSHTLKFLIGISPNGQITFISKCYGGRVTDCQLTQESGILDLLEGNDEMMADRVIFTVLVGIRRFSKLILFCIRRAFHTLKLIS